MNGIRSIRCHAGQIIALLALTVMMSAGCSTWVPVSGKTPIAFQQVTTEIPPGWMHYVWSHGAYLTKHGGELDLIQVRRWPLSTLVKGTNRTLEGDLLPAEIAEISLDSRRLDAGVGGLEVLDNSPTTIDGSDCYRIEYTFRNDPGLLMRTIEYGCAVGPWMYRFEYRAAAQHYFAAYLDDFEGMVKSADFTIK